MAIAIRCEHVFDGRTMHQGAAVIVQGTRCLGFVRDRDRALRNVTVQDLGEGFLVPGMLDLQVNGGGGQMVGPGCTVETMTRICAIHARRGATSIMPTLISDTPETTAEVIDAAINATRARVPGFLGLHLEGPHLDPQKRGAHDPGMLRPMSSADIAMLEFAVRHLPALMVTVAPEAVTVAQVERLTQSGVIVSLGHTACSDARALELHAAGASCATHLFNAMAPLSARSPGLAGAALASDMRVGLIADGVHVAASNLRLAVRAKDEDGAYLVSDAMALAGSSRNRMELNGRTVIRHNGALRLEDGTLAGADLSLPQAVANMCRIGVPLERALAMATRVPARIVNVDYQGRIGPGAFADMIHLSRDLQVRQIWQRGEVLHLIDAAL